MKEDVECAVLTVHGSLRHAALRLLQRGGLCVLSKAWRWPAEREVEAANAIGGIVGEASRGQDSMFLELTDRELQAAAEVFPHTTSSFGAALAAGVDWDTAILGHVQQAVGWYDTGGHRFRFSGKDGQPLGGKGARACKSFQIPAREGGPGIVRFWEGDQLLELESSASLRLQRPSARQVRDRDGIFQMASGIYSPTQRQKGRSCQAAASSDCGGSRTPSPSSRQSLWRTACHTGVETRTGMHTKREMHLPAGSHAHQRATLTMTQMAPSRAALVLSNLCQ